MRSYSRCYELKASICIDYKTLFDVHYYSNHATLFSMLYMWWTNILPHCMLFMPMYCIQVISLLFLLFIVIPTALTPLAQVGFLFYLRFSAGLNEEASVERVTDTIEIEVVSFVASMHSDKEFNLICDMSNGDHAVTVS